MQTVRFKHIRFVRRAATKYYGTVFVYTSLSLPSVYNFRNLYFITHIFIFIPHILVRTTGLCVPICNVASSILWNCRRFAGKIGWMGLRKKWRFRSNNSTGSQSKDIFAWGMQTVTSVRSVSFKYLRWRHRRRTRTMQRKSFVFA